MYRFMCPKIQTMGLKVLREISLDVCSAPFFYCDG